MNKDIAQRKGVLMFTKCLLGCAMAAFLVDTAVAQDAQTVIARVTHAIGADTLKTVQYSGTGFDFAFGQAPNPSLPWPKFIDKSYTRTIDFEAPASRVDRVRVQGENPPRGGGGQPLVGEQSQSQTITVSAGTPWAQELEIWITPYGFLRAASKKDAAAATRTINGKSYTIVSFTGNNHAKVNGYINDRDEVERVETWIDTPVLGDTHLEVAYSDYREVSGARFPTHIVQTQGDYPVLDLQVSDIKINVPATITAPAAGNASTNTPAPNPPAQSEKLGDGVYLITGGYSVIAVDFKDHITLFESGQSDARAVAVIAEVKRLIPGKPLRYVVNTHSHFDHSGGLRAVAAEGATILTYKLNKSYLEKVLSQPRTLNPDVAQQQGRKPQVQAVGEKTVLTDGTHVVELYHLRSFLHHDGMLVAYFPKEKVLFEADGYNPQPVGATPPNPASPTNLSLLDNIQRLHLDVQRIVPVHYPADNRVVTVPELTRWAGRSGT
jgi:glyoxylase-like metal-dependent hydrolase (beta-lactamase superfamily II)